MGKNERIYALYDHQKEKRLVEVFGYCTKGVPGLDVIGLGTPGRMIKEKLVFLSRASGLKMPIKRYVICLEKSIPLKEIEVDQLRWIELPILLLFWSLADQLSFSRLDNCVASGKVSASGLIQSRRLDYYEDCDELNDQTNDLKILSVGNQLKEGGAFLQLSVEEILSDIPYIRCCV